MCSCCSQSGQQGQRQKVRDSSRDAEVANTGRAERERIRNRKEAAVERLDVRDGGVLSEIDEPPDVIEVDLPSGPPAGRQTGDESEAARSQRDDAR